MGFVTSMNRKKHQRALNRVVKSLNEDLAKDELWRGRFFVRQVFSSWHAYEDKSGFFLVVILRFYDKKTNQYRDVYNTANHFAAWHGYWLFRKMNSFIVEDINVWANENPMIDKTDYTKVDFDCSRATKIRETFY